MLKVKSDLCRQRPWCQIVRAAEGRKKVVKRVLVGQVHGRQLQAHLVSVAVEHVVVSDRQIKQMARCDSRRILVVVLRSGRRNLHEAR